MFPPASSSNQSRPRPNHGGRAGGALLCLPRPLGAIIHVLFLSMHIHKCQLPSETSTMHNPLQSPSPSLNINEGSRRHRGTIDNPKSHLGRAHLALSTASPDLRSSSCIRRSRERERPKRARRKSCTLHICRGNGIGCVLRLLRKLLGSTFVRMYSCRSPRPRSAQPPPSVSTFIPSCRPQQSYFTKHKNACCF